MAKMVFLCCEAGYFDDDDGMFEIEANSAEDAARGYVEHMDARDCEAFTRQDHPYDIVVKRMDRAWRFAVHFEYVKSWHYREVKKSTREVQEI